VWAYRSLLAGVPDSPWLIKHAPPALERSLLHQVWWQYRRLPHEAREAGCDVLFKTDAGSVCPFRPAVTLSQDMLAYEPGETRRFGLSKARARLFVLRLVHNAAMRNADRVVFLTDHAANVIQKTTGRLPRYDVVPYGLGKEFRQTSPRRLQAGGFAGTIRLLYVSNAALHKHQWNVVRAVAQIRRKGIDVSLALVGGGKGRAQALLDREIAACDPGGQFVSQAPFVAHDQIPRYLAEADVFIFASSCESMPNTLLEAMASGLPIACSNRGPMPEVLKDGGIYFDPEDPPSLVSALEQILANSALRTQIANRAEELSAPYSWARCADATWTILSECARQTS
jgi:glycosyltransferase involved in cell wall biosynthesis